MRIYARRLLTEKGFVQNQVVEIKDGRIADIAPGLDAPIRVDVLTPGLMDLHCHGGQGFSARDNDLAAIKPFLDKMLSCGVTDFLMTISTGRREVMRHGLEITRKAMQMQKEGKLGGARVLGAHLEGPFLSTARPGAMEASAILRPGVESYEQFFAGYEDVIRMVTLAPEEEGAEELIHYLLTQGVCVQAGHTYAAYAEAARAFETGVESLCHSFNACRGIHHREPGVVTAALLQPHVYMEAICDLVHLHPAILQLIYRTKGPDRMILISDSVATHGLPDGEYFAEGYDVIVKDGVSRTADGALDGGGVYLDQAVRNIQSLGIPAEDAVKMASSTPAARMRLSDSGSIETGKLAHLTGWDAQWQPVFTVLEDGMYTCGGEQNANCRN